MLCYNKQMRDFDLNQWLGFVCHNKKSSRFIITVARPRLPSQIKALVFSLKVNFVANAPKFARSFVSVCYAMSRSLCTLSFLHFQDIVHAKKRSAFPTCVLFLHTSIL